MKSQKLLQPVRTTHTNNYTTPSKPNQLLSPGQSKTSHIVEVQGKQEVYNVLTPEKQDEEQNERKIIRLHQSQKSLDQTPTVWSMQKDGTQKSISSKPQVKQVSDTGFGQAAQKQIQQKIIYEEDGLKSELKISDNNLQVYSQESSTSYPMKDDIREVVRQENMKKVSNKSSSKQNQRMGQDVTKQVLRLEDQKKIPSGHGQQKSAQYGRGEIATQEMTLQSNGYDQSCKDMFSTQDDQDQNRLQNKTTVRTSNVQEANTDWMNTFNSNQQTQMQTQFSPPPVKSKAQDLKPTHYRQQRTEQGLAQQEQPNLLGTTKQTRSQNPRRGPQKPTLNQHKVATKFQQHADKRPSMQSNQKSQIQVEDAEQVPQPRQQEEVPEQQLPVEKEEVSISVNESKHLKHQDLNKLNLYYPNLLNQSRDHSNDLNRSRRSMSQSMLDVPHQERTSQSPNKKKYMEPTEAYLSKFRKELEDAEVDSTNEMLLSPTGQKKSIYFYNTKIKHSKFESVLKTKNDIKNAELLRRQQIEQARRQREWEEQERIRMEQEELERQRMEEEMREREEFERQLMDEEEQYSIQCNKMWKKQELDEKRRRAAEERLKREQEELRRQKSIQEKLKKMRQQQKEKNREMLSEEGVSPSKRGDRSFSSRASGSKRGRDLQSPSLWKLNRDSMVSSEIQETFPSPKSRREQFMNKKESQDLKRQGQGERELVGKRILNKGGIGSRSNSKFQYSRRRSPTRGELAIQAARKKNSLSRSKKRMLESGKINFRKHRNTVDQTANHQRFKTMMGRNASQVEFKSRYGYGMPMHRNFNLDEVEKEIVDRLYTTPRSGRTHSHAGGWLSCLTCTLQLKYKSNGQEEGQEEEETVQIEQAYDQE